MFNYHFKAVCLKNIFPSLWFTISYKSRGHYTPICKLSVTMPILVPSGTGLVPFYLLNTMIEIILDISNTSSDMAPDHQLVIPLDNTKILPHQQLLITKLICYSSLPCQSSAMVLLKASNAFSTILAWGYARIVLEDYLVPPSPWLS